MAKTASPSALQRFLTWGAQNPWTLGGIAAGTVGMIIIIAAVAASVSSGASIPPPGVLPRSPTATPTLAPTAPTIGPTVSPSMLPTTPPSTRPTVAPTTGPTTSPTAAPTAITVTTAAALSSGNSTAVTATELRSAVASWQSDSDTLTTTLTNVLWSTSRRLTAAASSPAITWNPTHDSVYFSIFDAVNVVPLFTSNFDYKYADSGTVLLAAAGKALAGNGGKFVAFGGNPLHDMGRLTNVGGGSGNAAFNTSLAMITRWLLDADSSTPSSQLRGKIVVAQQPGPSSYWFQHDASTRRWLTRNFKLANVTAINACDNHKLQGCLAGAKLLVIGRQMGRTADSASNNATTDVNMIYRAVRDFSLSGGAFVYT
jgi:hypothetical protein